MIHNGFEDRTIDCAACHQPFNFSAGEQDFYATRGFQTPKRCKPCRAVKKGEKLDPNQGRGELLGPYKARDEFQGNRRFRR